MLVRRLNGPKEGTGCAAFLEPADGFVIEVATRQWVAGTREESQRRGGSERSDAGARHNPSPHRHRGGSPYFRDGLRRLLEREEGFVIEGESSAGQSGVALVTSLQPDILLLGLASSLSRGVEMLQQLVDTGSNVRAIVLTDTVDTPAVSTVVATRRARNRPYRFCP